MDLGPRFDEALAYASKLHRHQRRKGGNIPYVAHLLAAAALGSGFSDTELEAIADHLRSIETNASPFADLPRTTRGQRGQRGQHTDDQTHWVHPSLVIEVKFTQWTADAVLRNPVYLGVRTDTAPADVRREDTRTSPRSQTTAVGRQQSGLPAVASAKAEGRRQEKDRTPSTRRRRRPKTKVQDPNRSRCR